jgi:hypothetical protein
VPILQALNITRDTAGNTVVANAINKIHDSVKEGESVVGPMEASGVFPPMVTSMVQVGEETGQLPDMLVKVADVYEAEVDNVVSGLTSILGADHDRHAGGNRRYDRYRAVHADGRPDHGHERSSQRRPLSHFESVAVAHRATVPRMDVTGEVRRQKCGGLL